MTHSKLVTLATAIRRHVPNHGSVVMGTALETCIPFAAGHEIIRQGIQNLTLVGPISDILFDQIIGAGCAERVQAAWVGNVITGSGYNFRRWVESGRIPVEDHTNLTIALALRAAAMGVPFLPCRTALGSDLPASNPGLTPVTCPFTGDHLTAVQAIVPDVAIVHVQRADHYGNALAWGNLGVTREALLAGKRVVLTAEEIVDADIIARDPNRVITPGFRVDAVVHAPWGAHPSPVPGFYNRDHQAFVEYRNQSRSAQSFRHWKQKWVDAVDSSADYAALLGDRRRSELAIRHPLVSEGVDYGY